MKLVKSLLLGSAAAIAAVAVAQAADLPSMKAAPVNYVKICDAYGAGFFFIPGTDSCIRLGGYVRAEYQYAPGQSVYSLGGPGASVTTPVLVTSTGAPSTATPPVYPVTGVIASKTVAFPAYQYTTQLDTAQSTTGYEVRGRIDVDARTPTDLGTARTFIRLRGANTSGIRNVTIANNAFYGLSDASVTALTVESALVQWAGFTFGIAPENYAMMPTFMYHSNPWTGFPNGMKQIAYTATFGGGFSATIALEDSKDMNNNQIAIDRVTTAAVVVGNIRLDQAWGFAGLHGMWGDNSYYTNSTVGISAVGTSYNPLTNGVTQTSIGNAFGVITAPSVLIGQRAINGWGLGSTLSYRLPMLAAGDQVWFTANYARGMLGALLSTGGLSNVSSTASDHRLIGGIVRVDTNVSPTSSTSVADLTGWNVAMAMTHYWAPQWRSNFTAGYVEINPPTVIDSSAGVQWGKGRLWEVASSIIYSPVRDLDIGLEVQYANLKNNLQNAPTSGAWFNAGRPGLNEDNWSTKLRVERTF